MSFIRENIVKILIFIFILVIFIVVFSMVFGKNKTVVVRTYPDMENSLKNAAIKYTNKNKKLLPKNDDETIKINLDTLVNEKYMSNLYAINDKKIKCTGYVDISYKNNKNIYVPYIKCGKEYETNSLADYIIQNEPIVTSADGLYKYGDTYVFRGENPKNFVKLGDRIYRIIDLTEDGYVRLISNKKLNISVTWDNRYNESMDQSVGINDFSVSRLKESLNKIINSNYNSVNDYKYFSDQELEKIVPYDICIGKRPSSFDTINSYNECQKVEKNQKVGLITVSDYARASIDQNCKSIYSRSCLNYNYFSRINSTFGTITATSDNSYQVFYIYGGVAKLTRASRTFSFNHVVYIDELSLYLKGDGTQENPYVVR